MPGKLRQLANKRKSVGDGSLLPIPKYANPKSTMGNYKTPKPAPTPVVPRTGTIGERGIYDNSIDVIRSLKGRGGVKSTSKD